MTISRHAQLRRWLVEDLQSCDSLYPYLKGHSDNEHCPSQLMYRVASLRVATIFSLLGMVSRVSRWRCPRDCNSLWTPAHETPAHELSHNFNVRDAAEAAASPAERGSLSEQAVPGIAPTSGRRFGHEIGVSKGSIIQRSKQRTSRD